MNNKFLILIIVSIIAICGVSAFLLTNPTLDNRNNENVTNNTKFPSSNIIHNKTLHSDITNHNGIVDENGIAASLNGPKQVSYGKSVTIIWKVVNNAKDSITNVEAMDQLNSHNFGTITPGESKTFANTLYVPTLAETEQSFGSGSTISNPFYIGGFSVTYNLNGENFQFNANPLEIQLI